MFDQALFWGMSSEEYWFGDPALIFNYQNAFNMRQKYDLQLAWTQGAYFKSALGSTQLWTVQPYKKSTWNNMPKYADCPFDDFKPKKELSEEEKKFYKETRERLNAMGLLRKPN